MAATFDPALTAAKDRIRQRIGDTDEEAAKVQDETIAAYLGMGMTELRVARRLCLDIAATYAGVGDVMIDDQRQIASKIYDHYIELARQIELEERPATSTGSSSPGIIVGGLDDPRSAIQDRPAGDYPACRDF